MVGLPSVLKTYVDNGSLPGAVGLVARGQQAEVAVVGSAAFDGAPMARDSIFRLASVTEPIIAAGRRNRNVGPHHPVYRDHRDPVHPGGVGRPGGAAVDAGLLAVRGG